MASDPRQPEPLLSLDALADAGRARVGGKGWQLGRLHQAGLPVPPTLALSVDVFERALWQTGLMPLAEMVERDARRAPELHAALLALSLPASLVEPWVVAARMLGKILVVRSSGIDEDGAIRSFAGQHNTVLGVTPDGVPDAVRTCWASLYQPSAMAYRGASGPSPGSLAVLLQPLIEPSCAGVMFTINPTNGSWREMVVEAVWGQGEGLVSGQITPHWFLVRRPGETLEHGIRARLGMSALTPKLPWRGRRPPGSASTLARIAERVQLNIVEQHLPEQPEWFTANGHSVSLEPTPAHLRRAQTLDPASLKRLCRLGLRIERAIGGPQDIEWARTEDGDFQILQTRPITASGTPRETSVLWTRRFMGERWPEPVTPLGWSLLSPILEWLIAYPETQAKLLGGGPALKLVSGRPYINATVFRHLAFKLPGSPPPRFMLELVPPDEEQAWRRRFAVSPDFAVYASIFRTTFRERRWERFRWNPFTNHLQWARFQDQLESELPSLAAPSKDADIQEVVTLVERHIEWVRRYVSIHVCSLLFANISWQLLENLLTNWLPERRAELMDALATCPPGNLTVETNAALRRVSTLASDADIDALADGRLDDLGAPLAEALRDFLVRFGHRSEASWEIMSPRWRRHPERLAPLLRAQRASPEGESPAARAERQEARYRDALDTLRMALSGPRLTFAELSVHYTRRYLLLRENQRFWFDKLLFSLQENLLWLGAALTTPGRLETREDVALLTWPELRALCTGTQDALSDRELTACVAARKIERQQDARQEPPTFLRDDDPAESPGDHHRLDGLAISRGRVRGRVRVIRSLAEGALLQQGEILVTRAVDPGWTPLFHSASAMVLEMGSLLSHGAVIAREYGLPAVVNIERATERLIDGQEITVDGTRGVIWLH